MAEIADQLEINGYSVFLPQRDGLEMAQIYEDLVDNGTGSDTANSLLLRAIFLIDTFQVSDSDGN